MLLDLADHSTHALALDGLPGIHDDPLKAIRAENAKLAPAATDKKDARADNTDRPSAQHSALKKDDKPKLRGVRIVSDAEDGGGGGIVWSDDGHALAIQLRAIDNKDRWIASVDFAAHALVAQHRLTDPAWINWNFNEFGWLNDNRTLWYVSEETGYAHLYTQVPGRQGQGADRTARSKSRNPRCPTMGTGSTCAAMRRRRMPTTSIACPARAASSSA